MIRSRWANVLHRAHRSLRASRQEPMPPVAHVVGEWMSTFRARRKMNGAQRLFGNGVLARDSPDEGIWELSLPADAGVAVEFFRPKGN
jgi:hypothetical protein